MSRLCEKKMGIGWFFTRRVEHLEVAPGTRAVDGAFRWMCDIDRSR
jgi:hypothetical protein